MNIGEFIRRVENADKKELMELFGPLMRKVREYSRSHAVTMLFDLDDDGDIDRQRFVVLRDENNFVPPDTLGSYDLHVGVNCHPFRSYDEIRERFVLPDLRSQKAGIDNE